MENKWTPGPWLVHGSHVYAPDHAILAVVQNPGSKESDYPLVANGLLIAKCPEMAGSLLSVIGDDSISGELPAVLVANIKRILREAGAID